MREPGLHHLAERFLHLACECVLDIAHHIISDEGYRQPETYRDDAALLVWLRQLRQFGPDRHARRAMQSGEVAGVASRIATYESRVTSHVLNDPPHPIRRGGHIHVINAEAG